MSASWLLVFGHLGLYLRQDRIWVPIVNTETRSARYEVRTVVLMNIAVFWDATHRGPVKSCHCFGRTWFLHIQGRNEGGGTSPFATSVTVDLATRRYVSEDFKEAHCFIYKVVSWFSRLFVVHHITFREALCLHFSVSTMIYDRTICRCVPVCCFPFSLHLSACHFVRSFTNYLQLL